MMCLFRDLFEYYLPYFESLIGNDYQRKEEIKDDLQRVRHKTVPGA